MREAFRGAGVGEIHIPDSVEELGDKCFFQCCSLFRVTFGESLKRIGKRHSVDLPGRRKDLVLGGFLGVGDVFIEGYWEGAFCGFHIQASTEVFARLCQGSKRGCLAEDGVSAQGMCKTKRPRGTRSECSTVKMKREESSVGEHCNKAAD